MRIGCLVIVAAACAVVVGCGSSGDEVPDNGVAMVGDTVISKADFQERLAASLASQAGSNGKPVKFQPPDFKACIEAKKQGAGAPEGSKGKDEAALKEECEQEYEQARIQVVEFLVQTEWVDKELRRRNMTVTEADIRKTFEKQKKQQFPKEADYRKFLRDQGRTEEDILETVRVQMLQQTLTDKLVQGKLGVSDAEARAYYERNKKDFGKPKRRNVRLVLTKDEATADRAKDALDAGESWAKVAREYSRDKATSGKGGLLAEITRTGDDDLDEAMDDAAVGEVRGPLKTQFGWVVFAVDKVLPAFTPPLKGVREQVVDGVKQQKRQRILDAFARTFRERYRGETVCADNYKVASCANGPESNPTASAPAMTQPQSGSQEE